MLHRGCSGGTTRRKRENQKSVMFREDSEGWVWPKELFPSVGRGQGQTGHRVVRSKTGWRWALHLLWRHRLPLRQSLSAVTIAGALVVVAPAAQAQGVWARATEVAAPTNAGGIPLRISPGSRVLPRVTALLAGFTPTALATSRRWWQQRALALGCVQRRSPSLLKP